MSVAEAPTGVVEISAREHHAIKALSASGMKDLSVSPMRYWYRNLRPDLEPEEPTPAQRLGTALHCAVLESAETFMARYACALDPTDWPICLDTIQDLREWITSKGHKPSGTRKDQVIAQALHIMLTLPECERVPILAEEERRFHVANEGKTILQVDEWKRVEGMASALLAEPVIQGILEHGAAEKSILVRDPDTGVRLKARLDWMSPTCTLDLKSFTAPRGKSIEKAITDAIYYEAYHRQAYFYDMVRRLTERGKAEHDFVMAFVESEPPYEVRIKALRPKFGGEVNTYWQQAALETRANIQLYARCLAEFGDDPWSNPQELDVLTNEDIRQFNY